MKSQTTTFKGREKVGTLDINLDNWAPISWGDGIRYRGPFIPADCIFSIRGKILSSVRRARWSRHLLQPSADENIGYAE